MSPHNIISGQENNSLPLIHSRPSNTRRVLKRQQANSNSTVVNQASTLNTTIVNQAKAGSRPPPGCFSCIIEDNNPLVHYEGVWFLSASQFSTTHSTTVSNSSVSLHFNGSGIIVFGTVPASNETTQPPTAVYFLDNYPPFRTTLPRAVQDITNQPLFASSQLLSSDEEHRLVISVQDVATPYTVEKFFVIPRANMSKNMMIGQITTDIVATSTSSSTISSATLQNFQTSEGSSQPSQNFHKILGGILGTVCFLLVVAGLAVIAVWRRRRAVRQVAVACPAAAKARPDTIYTSFTSTESILRNDSALWSPPPRSQYSRSDGRNYSRSTSDARSIVEVAPPLPPKATLSSTS
ncbi:hypothetical protein CVT25_013775 [Psilocybe cyanescens]|uniref:Uncharacterized protein n=1 Tax=Psilocybe cyanescens TaxID=93625 RepID=A0A409WTX4_PSICY|nr:hypothetical protein CVT25_013775 [Psilocybe cyanescens]